MTTKKTVRTESMELALLERIRYLGGIASTEDLHEVFKLQATSREAWQNRPEQHWMKALQFALIHMAKPERGWLSRPFGELGEADDDKAGRTEWVKQNRPGQTVSQVWQLESAGRHHSQKLRQLGVATAVDNTPALTAPYDPDALRRKILQMAEEVLNGR